jgi:hypothetical protein
LGRPNVTLRIGCRAYHRKMLDPEFLIEGVSHVAGQGVFVFARHVSGTLGFTFGPNATLAGLPIEREVNQPRKLSPTGQPDLELFAFKLKNVDDGGRLVIGHTARLSGLVPEPVAPTRHNQADRQNGEHDERNAAGRRAVAAAIIGWVVLAVSLAIIARLNFAIVYSFLFGTAAIILAVAASLSFSRSPISQLTAVLLLLLVDCPFVLILIHNLSVARGARPSRLLSHLLSTSFKWLPTRYLPFHQLSSRGKSGAVAVAVPQRPRSNGGPTLRSSRLAAVRWPGASAPRSARRCASRCRSVEAASG